VKPKRTTTAFLCVSPARTLYLQQQNHPQRTGEIARTISGGLRRLSPNFPASQCESKSALGCPRPHFHWKTGEINVSQTGYLQSMATVFDLATDRDGASA
jgi:hypothetical protein